MPRHQLTRKATSHPLLGIMIQALVALALSGILWAYADNVITEEDFTQQVHALDSALTAEVLTARNASRINIHTSYADTYRIGLEEERVTAQIYTSEVGGRSAHILVGPSVEIQEGVVQGHILEWLWYDNQLRLRPMSLARTCPSLATPQTWDSASAIGDAGVAQRIIQSAYPQIPDIQQYQEPDRSREELYLHLEEADELTLRAGTGTYNQRLRCLASQYFPQANIIQTTTQRDGLYVGAPNIMDYEQQLIELLEEAAQ